MIPLEERVIAFKDSDLNQGFNDEIPFFSYHIPKTDWRTSIQVDYFPCYSVDRNLVINTLKYVESCCPLPIPPHYFILPLEGRGRTNGWADNVYVYNGKDRDRTRVPYVVFSGKRIPIMQSMIRYLCAHEYGHCVDYAICEKRKYEDATITEFDKLYAKMRGIEANAGYGARRWHTNIGEIIANDFRITICNIEPEFWPHDVEYPNNTVKDFWKETIKELE